MKNYDEVTSNVMKRRDVYESKRARTRGILLRVGAPVLCVCLLATGAFIYVSNRPQTGNEVVMSGLSYTPTDYEPDRTDAATVDVLILPPDETAKTVSVDVSDICDFIGWLVLPDGRCFWQTELSTEEYPRGERLGRATDFDGAYSRYLTEMNGIDGDVYSVPGNDGLVRLELENGAVLILKYIPDSYPEDLDTDENALY